MSEAIIYRTKINLAICDIYDAATTTWHDLHADAGEADHHACKLCGETMYPCIDYTHAETCPLLVLERAIDAFAAAVDTALGGEGDTPPATKETEE